jgi:hypothetical protein
MLSCQEYDHNLEKTRNTSSGGLQTRDENPLKAFRLLRTEVEVSVKSDFEDELLVHTIILPN